MYHKRQPLKTLITVNTSFQGESLEHKLHRIINNKEPIKDGAPIIYTDRRDGVRPEYDIRTDRFELAVDAMDSVTKQHLAKRQSAERPPLKADGEIKAVQPPEQKSTENEGKP